ncbi:MAG: sulfatase-like hydrolase/transferase [Bacteroidota bacterium]
MNGKKSTIRTFVLISLIGLFACKPDLEQVDQPNIIWLVAEDISPALAAYGDTLANTPNIDRLLPSGIVYEHAYATAPICAPARSCLMTGMYATTLGSQHLRCEIPLPGSVQTLPEHLREAGYFTSNRNKADYNFDIEGRWDHWSGSVAPWRNRSGNKPFFSFINVGPSHEGSAVISKQYQNSIEGIPEDVLVTEEQVEVPPYYPDTDSMRMIWARYYNLLHSMDRMVGQVLDSLEEDGLMEETIIFFFGDHGFGLPRYKRWLYHTGLHVPLIVHVPEKYRSVVPQADKQRNEELVSFVDFGSTVLSLAGVEQPEHMQGQVFLGKKAGQAREYVFGARDRADDMFEMSRAVFDGKYLYIRHFMPHLPPIQDGFIYSDRKDAFRYLRRAKNQGILNEEQQKLWEPKPLEELYDLENDPQELTNLIEDAQYKDDINRLSYQLSEWMMRENDLGLLPEAEYMIRAEGSTPYELAKTGSFNSEEVYYAAARVGKADKQELDEMLKSSDSGVRYWAVIGLMQLDLPVQELKSILRPIVIQDASPSVQIQAAEALGHKIQDKAVLECLLKWVEDERPQVALQAARAILLIGENARPLISNLYPVLDKNLGEPGAKLKYKDFNFAAFTSWALEWALAEMGEDIQVNGGN